MGSLFPRKKKNNRPIAIPEGPLPEGRVRVSEMELDTNEVAILQGLRFIASSYAQPGSQAWECAFDTMTAHFGEAHGPVISYAVTNVMRTMRQSRKSCFKFNNPLCPCCQHELTAMEKHLMNTIKAIRQGKSSAAQTEAMMLCEGYATKAFLGAVSSLSALLPIPENPSKTKRMIFS